jgi:selenocysteine lyase/cysteine desulfurase
MVCMGMSSNALGTLNDFVAVKSFLPQNCLFLLDAVHFAPHFSINVKELGCDFLLCSAYKFYGPHVGFLYSKPGLLEQLETDRLVVQDQKAPYIIETGTLNHAACAGVSAAIDFIANIGEGNSFRDKLIDAFSKISSHEFALAKHLYESINSLNKVNVVGKDFSDTKRTPTVSFVHSDYTPQEICKALASENICAWDGHFYALKAIQQLGLEERGGVTRLGISIYNTKEEVERVVSVISKL